MSTSHKPPFALSGDSGSFVLNPASTLVGMVWGGSADGIFTYVVDAIELLRDIETRTGWKLDGMELDESPVVLTETIRS